MTRKRNDSHSTEFGLWLREQNEIDSSLGYLATNIDFMWTNYKTGQWMILEEKRYESKVKRWQRGMFNKLHSACIGSPGYCGIHLVQFENTSPDDGLIWLDHKEISRDGLSEFLQTFEVPGDVHGI